MAVIPFFVRRRNSNQCMHFAGRLQDRLVGAQRLDSDEKCQYDPVRYVALGHC